MFGETDVCLWASKDNIYEMVFLLPPYGFSCWNSVRFGDKCAGVWVRAFHASHVDVGGHFAGNTSFNHGPEDRTPGSQV